MNKLAELWGDILSCWEKSSGQYLTGTLRTIELALVATAIVSASLSVIVVSVGALLGNVGHLLHRLALYAEALGIE